MRKFWNWGMGVATVYTVFAGATLGFVVFAMQQPVDLVSPGYYAEAQAHHARQSAAGRAIALGEGFRVETDSVTRSITITWPAAARPESGEVRFYRPSDSRADQRQTLQPNAEGVQVISAAGLASGNWILQCEWTGGRELFYAERHITLR